MSAMEGRPGGLPRDVALRAARGDDCAAIAAIYAFVERERVRFGDRRGSLLTLVFTKVVRYREFLD
jgi:hypothetical protein